MTGQDSRPPGAADAIAPEVLTARLASVRHDVRNKLASIRNAVHYLRRRVESTDLAERDVRVERFFALIEDELRAVDTVLTERLVVDRGDPSDGST